ncbi:MAG TPA: hypothetical protein VFF06_26180 [Polyangia bacterium]|nr:hypothetical protein [Polyangia bacterium]
MLFFASLAGELLGAAPAAAKPNARPPTEASGYLDELEKRGLVDKGLGTPERLAAEVRAADDDLVAGRPAIAAARLYAIVEGPRWQDLSETDDFQDAEYRLGIALHRGGGGASARRYLARSLARGPKAPFYQAALRAYVDVCLDERVAPECVAELDKMQAEDLDEEIAYLRGRADFDAGIFSGAEQSLGRVSPRSRFYSSALYLRGVMRVNKRDWTAAQDAFCAVADTKEGDSLRFFIDGRYYNVRDLSRLALGRIAHEQGQYEDAFYHYFLIPSDSPKLPDALFEAAWSSLQRREYDLGARLIDEFLKAFPRSPRAFEARLLKATLEVKTCRFRAAEGGFEEFIRAYEPLMQSIDRAIADPETRRALGKRLLEREQVAPTGPADIEGRIAELLQVDARFFRLEALARGLRAEALDAAHVESDWRSLEGRVGGTKIEAVASGKLDLPSLAAGTDELANELARARAALRARNAKGPEADELRRSFDALEARRRELAANVGHALDARESTPRDASGLAQLVAADRERAGALRERVARLGLKLDAASGELVRAALIDLRGRVEEMLRRARLGKIDAVVGEKRKLERQIEDLAAGRFPPELFGRLHIEGLIGDDEEYWPPEAERWADEYENYK